MAVFTVQLELGPETRALIERLAGKAVIEVELGEATRDLVEEVVESVRVRGPGEAPGGG